MSVKDVAADLAALFKAADFETPGQRYWADDVVSVEPNGPPGMDPVSRGKSAAEAKGRWWSDNHEVTNHAVDGPYVNGDLVAFRFEMDVKVKASGQTMQMREFALYTIKDDRIVEERFLYGMD